MPGSGRGVAFGLALGAGGPGFGSGKGLIKGGFSAGRMRKGLASDLKIDADLLPCSFTEETVVEMCDGSLKQISEVQEGEEVLTRDQLTGDLSCRPVVHPYSNPDRAIIELTLLDEDGDFEVLETTDNHPFFVLGRGWTRVDELEIGDLVPSPDGQLEVVGLVWTGELETVYNFGVEEHRSYFVGELGAWVHNCFTTVIGRMKDLKKFDLTEKIDTWSKSGRIPGPNDKPISWRENRAWLQERIDRGDKFGLATDPSKLPPATPDGYVPGTPNGYFTARELDYLLSQGIKPYKMW